MIYLVEAEYDNGDGLMTWPVCYAKTKEVAERSIAIIKDKRESLLKLIKTTEEMNKKLVADVLENVTAEIAAKHGPIPEYYYSKIEYGPGWSFEKSETIRKQDWERNRPYYAYTQKIHAHPNLVKARAEETTKNKELYIRHNKLVKFNTDESVDYYYLQNVDRFNIVEVEEAV